MANVIIFGEKKTENGQTKSRTNRQGKIYMPTIYQCQMGGLEKNFTNSYENSYIIAW